MKAFKIVALVFLGIFLSLSLLVFGVALTVNQSALSADFIADRIDEIDLVEVTDELIIEHVPEEAADFLGDLLRPVLQHTVGEIEPWLKEQTRHGIHIFYDYIEGRSQTLGVIISLETMMESFRDNLLDAVIDSPPVELLGLNAEEIEVEFNKYYDMIEEEIPSELELDESLLGAEAVEQIERAKQYVGYFNLGFILLIVFILLLILLMILVYREVRGSCRQIGFTFLGVGVVSLVGAFVARSFAASALANADMDLPATLQAWASHTVTDVFMSLYIYSAALTAVGIAMVIVSFFYKRDEYIDSY